MPMDCPHCTKSIDAVPQAEFKSRLDTKSEENAQLKKQLLEAAPKVARAEAAERELADTKAQLTTVREQSSRQVSAARLGLPDEALTFADLAYRQATEAVEEGQRPTFDAWLQGDGKAHPAVAGFLGRAAAGAAAGAQAGAGAGAQGGATGQQGAAAGAQAGAGAGAAAGARLDASAQAAGRQGGMTPDQLATYFASSEWRSMPSADRAKRLNELEQQTAQGSSQP